MFIKLTSATTGEPVWLNMDKAMKMTREVIRKRASDYEVTRIYNQTGEHWTEVVEHPDSPAFAGISSCCCKTATSITNRGADAL